jgi:hypothetical protein
MVAQNHCLSDKAHLLFRVADRRGSSMQGRASRLLLLLLLQSSGGQRCYIAVILIAATGEVQPSHLAELLLSGTGLLAGHSASARCPRQVGAHSAQSAINYTSMHLISSKVCDGVHSSDTSSGLPLQGEAAT